MTNALLSLLLSIQLTLPAQPNAVSQPLLHQPNHTVHSQKVWWGLIDPDLALWFSRIPAEAEGGVLWDWSWRGFFAALFCQPLVKEDSHASSV